MSNILTYIVFFVSFLTLEAAGQSRIAFKDMLQMDSLLYKIDSLNIATSVDTIGGNTRIDFLASQYDSVQSLTKSNQNIVYEKVDSLQYRFKNRRLRGTIDQKFSDSKNVSGKVLESSKNELSNLSNAPTLKNDRLKGMRIPENVELPSREITGVTEISQTTADIQNDIQELSSGVKDIKGKSVTELESVSDIAEDKALKIDEVAAIQNDNSLSLEDVELYKKALAQYKEEKRIEAELIEKSKELATDVVTTNQNKVDESLKKISKYRRKLPSVHDLRNLPKHLPNPMKALPLRERVLVGLELQTMNSQRTWVTLDPSILYRLTSNLSAGIGGVYRFSMESKKYNIGDFGNLYGFKGVLKYQVVKGFFTIIEGHRVSWKPWETRLKDPHYRETVNIAILGIGRSHAIAERIKGNVQALYHHSWKGDPYKPKVMLRIGVEFSLVKKDKPLWKQKLKEMKNCD